MLFTPHCPCCNKTPRHPHRGFCQHITHLMLMTRCNLNCPSDVMPKDWYIDLIWLIRTGMIQQHHMIYSGPNILRQDCSEGIGCQGSVCFHLLSKYHSCCRLQLLTEARKQWRFQLHTWRQTIEITASTHKQMCNFLILILFWWRTAFTSSLRFYFADSKNRNKASK